MRWIHRVIALVLTSMVWAPAFAPLSAVAAPACDRVETFDEGPDGYRAAEVSAAVVSLIETSGLVSFSLTDTSWVITTAATSYGTTSADGSQISGQQILASPGPSGVLAAGEHLEFCLKRATPPDDAVSSVKPVADRAQLRAPTRIVAL